MDAHVKEAIDEATAWVVTIPASFKGRENRTPEQRLASAVALIIGELKRKAQRVADAELALTLPADPVEAFLAEVRAELTSARLKFPGDRIMTLALAEEFGELVKAVLDESSDRVRKEAVQTAVMAARVALDGDGSVALWRAEAGLDRVNGEEA